MQRARTARFVPAVVAGLVTSVVVAALAVAGGSSTQAVAAGGPPTPSGQPAGQLVLDGKTIPILSYSAGVSNSGTIGGAGGGAGAGKASFSSLSLIKNVDASSPDLFTAVATGEHFPEAVFTAQWGTGPSSTTMTFELENVLVVSAQQSGGGAAPSESLALDFGKVTWTHTDAAGSTSGSWNVVENAP
jgi:type VI secretion system secreted protein Hcp